MKNYLKRTTTFFLALLMLVSVPLQAFAAVKVDHNDIAGDKDKYVNKLTPVQVAKPEAGKTAEDLIKNPGQPAIYTLRTDYKVQKGDKYEINYQPYIASVGEAASDAEKAKVKKEITLPDLAGYDKSYLDNTYTIDYDTIKNAGKNGSQEFLYKAKSNDIKIKHLFQDMKDFTKYTNPGGDDQLEKITTQNGNTGSTMEVSPLNENDRRGFIPEAAYITMQVPEDATDFVLEYRYNRAHYNVDFDTMGGTPIATRTYYYDQEIPKIEKENIPTKIGCDFLGWKPSHDLQTTDGKTYKANQIINKADGTPALDLDVKLKMPALLLGKDEKSRERLKFTAVWKDKEKADYAIQFWVEKADHADNAGILDKYDYMGTRVYKDVKTGSTPNLDAEPVNGLKFPDLDQKRLEKIWAGEKFYGNQYLYLNKFFVYNKELTGKQNIDPNTNVTKTVSATGKTVYNIYYDRQVYDLYFTKSNALPAKNTFYPEIYVPDGNGGAKLAGGPGNPYHYTARFNQLMLGWPNDAMQTKGFDEGKQSYGWGPNYGVPEFPIHLDTPPYRLNADEFLDMSGYDDKGGYVDHIDKGDGTTIDVKNDPRYKDEPYKALSFGIKQESGSMPHHMDFWMDGFKDGETIIRYDLYRSKADTNSLTYGHKYSRVQGFTPYGSTIEEGSEEHGRVTEDDIGTLNDERGEITPYPGKKYTDTFGFNNALGQMNFKHAFFNNADPWGDPEGWGGFDTNGYIRFKYHRNKYPLRFNYDPTVIKDDSEFNKTNSLDTFYEFPLKVLNPELVPDDTTREDREYFKENPKNFLDDPKNLQTLGLTDLVFTDKDGKLKVKRPEGLSDQMVFKGWALDPAGNKLIWENPKETMPNHPLNLYAKWGEPDYKWKVTFDPDGGKLKTIKEEKLTEKRKAIQEGDIGQEEQNTYAKKGYLKEDPTTPDGKQIFTVIQRQKLVKPVEPVKKGYDFMGWEVIRYKKNEKGDYTDQIDTSYRDKYGVPELYTFGNDVVGPVYLKAIWNPNQRVDVKVVHHFLDKDCKKDGDPLVEFLENKRTGYYTATTGDQQGQKWILAPHEELVKSEDENVKKQYEEYNKNFGFNNTYFQNQRIEPEKIIDKENSTENETVYKANPNYKGNEFHFFYRPFRQREYTVNYIDERGKEEVEKFFEGLDLIKVDTLTDENEILEANQANKEKFEVNKGKLDEILKKHRVVGPEAVTNGNRHYDARNFRPIPGWRLTSDAQQQLFFDLNEDTNEFLGINGTGSDQIFFYYKDVRVIEVPNKDDPVPDGYVRVTYKADKGGAFTDKDGNLKTELYYDVIKGLKSDLLPVPKELEEGKEKEEGKYYITPETGKKFVKWDKKPLLNKNTILDNDTKDFYVFTAKFEWSGLTASGLVRTEAFTDPNGKWTNNFTPTIDDLKKQLVWKEKDQAKDLPAGAKIQLFDEAGNELTSDDQVYELVNEKKAADKDELVRTVKVKAKVTFKDGKEPQELIIPITVYKNVYEALTGTEKPLFLSQAEGKEAKDGGLKDVTGNYVKVTVAPTGDLKSKDNKVYYVNPKAWVEIPEVDTKDNPNFTNWTANKKAQNEKSEENGVYDFTKRHKFTEDTVISPGFSKDVVPQDGEDKPKVPDSYVKVIVDLTDKAKIEGEEKQTQTFWVNPTKEVTLPVTSPSGKEKQKVTIEGLGEKEVNYVFKEWQKVKAGEADDKLIEVKPAVKMDLAKNQFNDKVTVIEAVYKKSIAPGKIEEPLKTTKLDTPQGKEITNDDLIKKITPQEGKVIESIEVISKPDGKTVGNEPAKVIVKYKDGSTQGTNDNPVVIPVEVHKNIIPEAPGGQRPKDALDNYVKVIFKAGEGGSVSGDLVYYVSPEVEVDMTESAKSITKTPDTGYIVNGEKWTNTANKILKGTFTEAETVFIFNFEKSTDIVEKVNENTKKPDGYVTVIFRADVNGKLEGNVTEKTYYVNPKAGIKLVQLADGESAGEKQLAVPKTSPAANYEFDKWYEEIDTETAITSERIHVAKFRLAKVTLTYQAGEGTGTVPVKVEVDHGTSVRLARPEGLSKENATFAGWKIGETTYQAGDQVTLNENTTATAVWEAGLHTVEFDTDGAGYISSQKVKHNELITPVTNPQKDDYFFTGWKIKGTDTVFDPTKDKVTKDITLVAQYSKDIIPQTGDNKPEGVPDSFVLVEFKEGSNGSLAGTTKYWVNPAAGKKLSDITHPSVTTNEGWKHTGWDKEDTTEITKAIEVTAKYLEKVLTTDPNDAEKYVKVEFKQGEHGTIDANATSIYWVLKDEAVTLTPPKVNPGTGYAQKTGDGAWSPKVETSYSTDTEHVAQYDYNGKDVIPQPGSEKPDNVPENFVLVEFKPGDYGSVASTETVKYWVNPTKIVTLTPPTVTPNAGYEQERGLGAWDKYLTGIFSEATTITAQYRKIEVPTPPTPGNPDNPDKQNPGYPGGPDYPYYPGRPIPMYPEVRYETIIQEKIVKVPVPVSDNYFKEVRYMQGFNGYFRPNDGLTRAEAAQILANALVEDGYKYNPNFKISYKDVGEAWYTRAVKIVTEANVFAGYDDGNFKPQAKITRNEWIATLKRFQELGDASGNNMKLSDNHWAKSEIQAAFNEGWLKIYTDGLATYKGDEFIPRQEVAAVSNKAFKRIVDKAYIGKNNLGLVTYKDVNTSMWAYEDILCASNTFLDRKDRYIAHWYKEDKNQFNIDTSSFDIVQKNFQRNPR